MQCSSPHSPTAGPPALPPPAPGFLPSIGRLLRYVEPSGPNVRCDSGVQEGSEISMHYDPLVRGVVGWSAVPQHMVALAVDHCLHHATADEPHTCKMPPLQRCPASPRAQLNSQFQALISPPQLPLPPPLLRPAPPPLQISKLVTRGVDRPSTLGAMRRALDSYVIRGVQHNAPLLRSVLDIPAFEAGQLSTAFLAGERGAGGGGEGVASAGGERGDGCTCMRLVVPAHNITCYRFMVRASAPVQLSPPSLVASPPLLQSTSPPPSPRRPNACR